MQDDQINGHSEGKKSAYETGIGGAVAVLLAWASQYTSHPFGPVETAAITFLFTAMSSYGMARVATLTKGNRKAKELRS